MYKTHSPIRHCRYMAIVLSIIIFVINCVDSENSSKNRSAETNNNDSENNVYFDSSRCSSVTGTSNGLQFSGRFIMDTLIYLDITFKNISNKPIVFFSPYYYGNQGVKTLGFVKIIIPEMFRRRILNGGVFVSSIRSFSSSRLEPGDSATYRQEIGACENKLIKPIPFKLKYEFQKDFLEDHDGRLRHPGRESDSVLYWFGLIITDSSYICCERIHLTKQIFFK